MPNLEYKDHRHRISIQNMLYEKYHINAVTSLRVFKIKFKLYPEFQQDRALLSE